MSTCVDGLANNRGNVSQVRRTSNNSDSRFDERTTTIQSSVEAVRRYLESLPPYVPISDEIKSYVFWKAVRSEFLATLLVIVIGCGSNTGYLANLKESTADRTNDNCKKATCEELLVVSLSFGFIYAVMTECIGGLSGGHLNPAVTIAMLICRNVSPLRAFMYITAQITAAISGSAILYGLTYQQTVETKAMYVPWITILRCESFPSSQAFGLEFLATFTVILVYMSVTECSRSSLSSCKSLYIGLSYSVGHLFTYCYTGGSMNPARSIGPAIIHNVWNRHWVYWVGPLLGAILAGFTFDYTKESTDRRNAEYHATPVQETLVRTQSGISAIDETVLSNDCRV